MTTAIESLIEKTCEEAIKKHGNTQETWIYLERICGEAGHDYLIVNYTTPDIKDTAVEDSEK